ncbi:MAG: CBASS cGAMP synthase [Fibrobacteraceae bacterium]
MTSKTLNDGFHEYLDNIKVTQKVKDTLEDVRIKVRHALTEGIGAETEKEGQRIRPRFMTQGSARYKTQNMPCNPPKQQIDYDYGCYLPLSYHEDDGSCKPQKAAKDFFDIVGGILSRLASQHKGWKYEEHKKCCRLVVSEDIHFDVPLYSVPDKELKTIRDSRVALESVGAFSQSDSADQEEKDLEWKDLPTESIMLAENDGENHYSWRASDPRLLNVYFEGKSDDDHAIYRILKGWRDYNWQNGDGPSSIFLMSLAEKACNKTGFSSDIESELKDALRFIETCPLKNEDNGLVSVENPADSNDTIKCPEQEFQKLQQYARGFRSAIVNSWASLTDVCVMAQSHLGGRFPILSDVSTPNFREPPRTTRAG